MIPIIMGYKNYLTTLKRLKRSITVLILCNTLIAIGSGLTSPLLVRYLETLGATPSNIGFVQGLNYLAFLFTLIGGYFGDVLNRKKLIIVSYCFFAFGLLWFLFAKNWIWILPGFLLLGSKSISGPAADAVMAEETEYRERGTIYSIMWISVTLATIFSSLILARIVSRFGVFESVKFGFFIFFNFVIISIALLYVYLNITSPKTNIHEVPSNGFLDCSLNIIKNASNSYKNFFIYYVIETPARIILSTYYVLFLTHIVKITDENIAIVFSAAMIVYLFAQMMIGPFIDRTNRANVLSLLILSTLLSTILFMLFYEYYLIPTLFCVIMLATMFLEQYMHIVFMADVSSEDYRGLSLGLIQTISGLESALCVVIGGMLYELNFSYPFLLSIVLLAISLTPLRKMSKAYKD